MCHLDNLLVETCPIKEGKFFAKGSIFKFLIDFVPLVSTSPWFLEDADVNLVNSRQLMDTRMDERTPGEGPSEDGWGCRPRGHS